MAVSELTQELVARVGSKNKNAICVYVQLNLYTNNQVKSLPLSAQWTRRLSRLLVPRPKLRCKTSEVFFINSCS